MDISLAMRICSAMLVSISGFLSMMYATAFAFAI